MGARKAVDFARGVTVAMGGSIAFDLWCAWSPPSAVRRWPNRFESKALRRTAWAVTAAGLVAPWVYGLRVRPALQHWGATDAEHLRDLPGDDLTRDPWFTITRAVTIEAPAEEVWPWLAQIGQDRGGFYSYDWLENLAGCRLQSADRIHPEWQDLQPGDEIMMMPGLGTPVAEVVPGRAIVIEGWGTYAVEPVDEHSCRLIARAHQDRSAQAIFYVMAVELPHAIMERKMLLGIKERAERAHALAA